MVDYLLFNTEKRDHHKGLNKEGTGTTKAQYVGGGGGTKIPDESSLIFKKEAKKQVIPDQIRYKNVTHEKLFCT